MFIFYYKNMVSMGRMGLQYRIKVVNMNIRENMSQIDRER
jgi:hypothetical protein